MLDPRVYRAGWLPVVFAIVVVAFSLRDPPGAHRSSVPTVAFDGGAAASILAGLAADPAVRDRRPGSPGDRALAARVARRLAAAGFTVRRRPFTGRTVDGKRRLITVTATKTGFTNRQILVVADRSALSAPATAGLSATAGLLELAEVLGGRTLHRTVVLASTSGGPGGAGEADLAARPGAPVDAVLVLGDLAGRVSRRPWVVPWSDRSQAAPWELRRTVADALREETRADPGSAGVPEQVGRLAFPLTLGGQGPVNAAGIPAVLVSASGERGPGGATAIDPGRFEDFGRGVLRAISALDGAPAPPPPGRWIDLSGQLVPAWAVRLLVGALLLPVVLALVDGLARVRRRRQRPAMWLGWAVAGALPFALAALAAVALRLAGALGAAAPSAVAAPLDAGAVASLVVLAAVLIGGWVVVRALVVRALGVEGDVASPAAAAGGLALGLLAALVLWVANPFAAALLVPALHLWLAAVAPAPRPRRWVALALVLAGLLPAVVVALAYALRFGLGPLELVWTGTLAVAGGAVPLGAALAWSAALGAFASVLLVAAHDRPSVERRRPVTVRGPATYAGPGSLGGTESALRR